MRQFIPSTAGPTAKFFQTVDAPSLPQAPTAPHRSRLMMIAMIMGLITGLVAAVIAEIPRLARLYDERDVNYFIGVPMLAAILGWRLEEDEETGDQELVPLSEART